MPRIMRRIHEERTGPIARAFAELEKLLQRPRKLRYMPGPDGQLKLREGLAPFPCEVERATKMIKESERT